MLVENSKSFLKNIENIANFKQKNPYHKIPT